MRLVFDQGAWKVFTLFTYLKELKGHEESTGKNRPNGVEHGEHISEKNWLDKRKAEQNFEDGLEPTVLIMGEFILLFLTCRPDDRIMAYPFHILTPYRSWTRWAHSRSQAQDAWNYLLNGRPRSKNR